jgi:hypothetical protein
VANCDLDDAARTFYIVTTATCFAFACLSSSLLAWRVLVKGSALWDDGCFSPLEGFLMWASIYGICEYLSFKS